MKPIVIIGGGITGAFTAFQLAKNGHAVIILDEEVSPYKATDCNPGGINPHHGPDIPGKMEDFHHYCLAEHLYHKQEIQDSSGIDFNFRVIERLFVALCEDEKKNLLIMRKRYEDIEGFEASWCSKQEVAILDERITTECIGGLLTKGNITVDATLYTKALQSAAEKYGARFLYGTAIDFIKEKDVVTHVVTASGKNIGCSKVILCAGFWVNNLLKVLKVPISIHALKGQLLTIENSGKPFKFDITHGLTGLYHYKDNLYWLGGTTEEIEPESGTTGGGKRKILDNIAKIIPGLTDFEVCFHGAGYRPVSDDKLPIVGKIPGFHNVYIGTAGGSKGILHSAGIAAELLKYIEDRSSKEYQFLTPERFTK